MMTADCPLLGALAFDSLAQPPASAATACTPMLDFSKLKTPPTHGSVLVEPAPQLWLGLARENNDRLRSAKKMILDRPLWQWRAHVRKTTIGRDDSLIVVTGHQPAFIHPGVWAKHVVAKRAADALHALALNLVVDNDAVKPTTLSIPTVTQNATSIRHIRFARCPVGTTYEQLPAMSRDMRSKLMSEIRTALGDRYESSQWPKFFRALQANPDSADWVAQQVKGRQAIERSFGISLTEQRISSVRCNPLAADILLNADPFARSYNKALAEYRRTFRIRGTGRPIPDLDTQDQRCEVPFWIFRGTQPRQRLFVEKTGASITLYADRKPVAELHLNDVLDCERLTTQVGDWRIRPRALSLTLWARLLLADLFVHGIGGAKYDRITDRIIEDYYQVKAPAMACVSATLHPMTPTNSLDTGTVRRIHQTLRDMQYNPQRHLPCDAGTAELVAQKKAATALSDALAANEPHHRAARQEAFAKIRQINATLFAKLEPLYRQTQQELQNAKTALRNHQIAQNREFFFGHFDDDALQLMLDALPAATHFAV